MDGADQAAEPAAPKAPERDGKYQARQVDKFSRKCFPFSFIVFNIVYWAVYSSGESSSHS